jgi:hypothetical protein
MQEKNWGRNACAVWQEGLARALFKPSAGLSGPTVRTLADHGREARLSDLGHSASLQPNAHSNFSHLTMILYFLIISQLRQRGGPLISSTSEYGGYSQCNNFQGILRPCWRWPQWVPYLLPQTHRIRKFPQQARFPGNQVQKSRSDLRPLRNELPSPTRSVQRPGMAGISTADPPPAASPTTCFASRPLTAP